MQGLRKRSEGTIMPGLEESDGLPGWWYALQGWQKRVFQREVFFFLPMLNSHLCSPLDWSSAAHSFAWLLMKCEKKFASCSCKASSFLHVPYGAFLRCEGKLLECAGVPNVEYCSEAVAGSWGCNYQTWWLFLSVYEVDKVFFTSLIVMMNVRQCLIRVDIWNPRALVNCATELPRVDWGDLQLTDVNFKSLWENNSSIRRMLMCWIRSKTTRVTWASNRAVILTLLQNKSGNDDIESSS